MGFGFRVSPLPILRVNPLYGRTHLTSYFSEYKKVDFLFAEEFVVLYTCRVVQLIAVFYAKFLQRTVRFAFLIEATNLMCL